MLSSLESVVKPSIPADECELDSLGTADDLKRKVLLVLDLAWLITCLSRGDGEDCAIFVKDVQRRGGTAKVAVWADSFATGAAFISRPGRSPTRRSARRLRPFLSSFISISWPQSYPWWALSAGAQPIVSSSSAR